MGRFSKLLIVFGIALAILIIGKGVAWLTTPKGQETPSSAGTPVASRPASTSTTGVFQVNPRQRPMPLSNSAPPVVAPTVGTAGNISTNWEDKLDDILGSEVEESAKAKQLLALFPTAPEDGQVEIAQHLSNLVADNEYEPLGKLLTNSRLPETVLDVLMVDVLNRPNALKLPLLLEIARDGQHPKAAEAKDLLELYLEQDYGNDWGKWQAQLQQWIRDNPD